jgi:hypothetical protein
MPPATETNSATGLTPDQVAGLNGADAVILAEWRDRHAGMDGFIPQSIRRMPLETQLELARNPALDEAWREHEVSRIAKNPLYFIESFGSVEPPRGAAIPFVPWPAQREVMSEISDESKIWILKARRLGLTWLVLHYGFWIAAFDPLNHNARVLVFCKNRGDAGKLLDRVKAIHDRLPPWLRQATGRDSVTALELPDRQAELIALPATEGAARQETATLVVLDEFAFPKNGSARGIWTAVQPTIEGGGQLIGISTGNGRTGDGETFAQVWDLASAEENGVSPIFLPWNARPDRSAEWREAQRADYLSDEEFQAEYPEDPDEALAGQTSIHVYPQDGIASAVRIGAALEDQIEGLRSEGYEWGIDWGDFQTFAVYALPLPGGGAYIVDEKVLSHVEPSRAAEAIISHRPGEDPEPRFIASRADSAPAGTNATFSRVLDEARSDRGDVLPDSHLRIPFSRYKEGGGERKGVNTVAYIRRLLETASGIPGEWKEISDLSGILAIHPRCEILLAQMRGLERDSSTGKVRKPGINPRDPTKGDHGPDALIALLAPRAAEWAKGAQARRENAEAPTTMR